MFTNSKSCYLTRKFIYFLFFLLFWIIPIIYTGSTNKDFPLYPRTITYLHRISYLFTAKVSSWPVYYIIIKHKHGDDWINLKEEDYFSLKPFGHRTRLPQVLSLTHNTFGYGRGLKRIFERYNDLAIWIKDNYENNKDNKVEIEELKFVLFFYNTNNESSFDGHWKKPEFTTINQDSLITLYRYKF